MSMNICIRLILINIWMNQSAVQQKHHLPPLQKPHSLQLNSSLKRLSKKKLRDHQHRSARQPSPSPMSPSLKEEKVISHFLIRYLERKQHFEEKEKEKDPELWKAMATTTIIEEKKSQKNIKNSFRRAYLKRKHSPKKPLQTRFLIANYESIVFV